MRRGRVLSLLFVAICLQSTWASPPPGNDISQGLWWLYQGQYDKAIESFDRHIASHPDDPSGYFYKLGTDWWHMAQENDYDLGDIEKRFYKNADECSAKAKRMAAKANDSKTKAKAYLYWGGSEGMRGRLLVTKRRWVKAYFAGKNGHKYLLQALKHDPELYDAYLGLGIYDYFTDTMSGVIKALSALLIHGDRARGLQELETAIEKGEHSRVEAMVFLVEIYNAEENTPDKALPIARRLRDEFPKSPLMHLMELSSLYTMKDWAATKAGAIDFLRKCEKETPYYYRSGIRPARYMAGVACFWGDHNYDEALRYFQGNIDDGVDPSRWVTFAFLRRGQIYDLHGEREKAVADYNTVLSRPDVWGSWKEARQFQKEPFKFQ